MDARFGRFRLSGAATLILLPALLGQSPGLRPTEPDFIRQGQQLLREGKPDDALSLYRTILEVTPDSLPASIAAGSLLDWMGKADEARPYFQKAIAAAKDGQSKADAQRAMAMSWAFGGNCKKAVEYEQMVFAYYATLKDSAHQAEIADEAARVCLDAGEFDTAFQWYFTGHDVGMKQPGMTPARKSLGEFRWEQAQAWIAARKGNQTETDRHVAAATAILDKNKEIATSQAWVLPYLTGYVAFYRGDYETARAELEKANQDDPFIQCLTGDTYERLGQVEKSKEFYRRAASTTAHNPAAAYARPYAVRKLTPAALRP
jgi:tetratricopeptide (TPR) repeat protein